MSKYDDEVTAYRFYTKPSNELAVMNKHLDTKDLYPLYAITDSKKLYKRFKNERDMDKFILKKSTVSKDEWVQIANGYRGQLLDEYVLDTFDSENTQDNIKTMPINVLCTWFERSILDDQIEIMANGDAADILLVNPFVFHDEFIKELDITGFMQLSRMTGQIKMSSSVLDDDIVEEMDSYEVDVPMQYDDFQVYLNLFGELYSL